LRQPNNTRIATDSKENFDSHTPKAELRQNYNQKE